MTSAPSSDDLLARANRLNTAAPPSGGAAATPPQQPPSNEPWWRKAFNWMLHDPADSVDGTQPPPPVTPPPSGAGAGSADGAPVPTDAPKGKDEGNHSRHRWFQTLAFVVAVLFVGLFLGVLLLAVGARIGWLAPSLWWIRLVLAILAVPYAAWQASKRLLIRRVLHHRVVAKNLEAPERNAEFDKIRPTVSKALAPLLVPVVLIMLPLVGPHGAPSGSVGNRTPGTQPNYAQLCASGTVLGARGCAGVLGLWAGHDDATQTYLDSCSTPATVASVSCTDQRNTISLHNKKDADDMRSAQAAINAKTAKH